LVSSEPVDEIRPEAAPVVLRLVVDDDDGRFEVPEFGSQELPNLAHIRAGDVDDAEGDVSSGEREAREPAPLA
jgi:hypothetical protein